tara:strand:+ start:637 stop:873 length:237 start_codon:yes stop_codon:yes gene_type:complete
MSEQATARQLWTINDLAIKLGKEFSLPLTKDEASLIIGPLKMEEKNSFPVGQADAILDRMEQRKKTAQEEYWAIKRKN